MKYQIELSSENSIKAWLLPVTTINIVKVENLGKVVKGL